MMGRDAGLRVVGAALLGAGLVAFLGCDSGGGGGGLPAAESDSFSPVVGLDSGGNQVKLSWVYEINGGDPVVIQDGDVNLSVSYGNYKVTLDPGTLERETTVSGNMSGTVMGMSLSGDVSENLVESILLGAGTSTIEDQQYLAEQNTSMSVMGMTVTVQVIIDLLINFTTPCEWFPDRNDLDTLAVGYVYTPSPATGQVTGSVTMKMTGEPDDVQTVDQPFSSPETWEIMEKLASMTVAGTTYSNVVKVDRTTANPSSGEELTYTYWLAQGIGPIKMVGLIQSVGIADVTEPIELDLIETNLKQATM